MWFAKVLSVSLLTAGALIGIAYLAGKKIGKNEESKEDIYLWDEEDVPYDTDP